MNYEYEEQRALHAYEKVPDLQQMLHVVRQHQTHIHILKAWEYWQEQALVFII